MPEGYELDNNDPVIVYGFGLQGKRIYNNLKKNGFRTIYIVDQCAKEISGIDGKEVYPPSALDRLEYKEYPVIIGIHDSMQQDEVVTLLVGKGYRKIIAIPLRIGGRGYIIAIRKIYNLILDNCFEELRSIPYYSEEDFEDRNKISESGSFVTFWLDSIYLYAMQSSYAVRTGYSKLPQKDQDDISMLGNVTHDVFDYFINGRFAQKYVHYEGVIQDHIELNHMNLKDFWAQRKHLYEFYSEELRVRGVNYFIDNPLDVELNHERNRFNLLDGHHRVGFLLASHYAKIPVRTSRNSYEYIVNKANQIAEWCRENRYPNIADNEDAVSINYMQMLETLYGILKEWEWRSWSFLVIGDVFFAQHLEKEGVRVTLVTNDKEAEWVNQELDIHRLMYVAEEDFASFWGNYDCVVIHRNRICNWNMVREGLSHRKIERVVWYSGMDPETEKQELPENIRDLRYECFRYYFDDLKEQEWGIFKK